MTQGYSLLLEILENIRVVIDELRIRFDDIQLTMQSVLEQRLSLPIHTAGRFSTVAREPNEPSPMAILRNFTGGFDVEKRCFVMYGCNPR